MTEQLLRDRAFMLEAIGLAGHVPTRPWPNPPVGAIIVRDDGQVVGRGAHCGPGTAHAEITALQDAGGAARGATLYCTLEPCNHHGRTPPCAPRVAASGIRRLVVGIRDPNPAVAGGGLEVVRRAGIEVTVGVAAEPAAELVWPFIVTGAFRRPYVLLKTATSIDGRFAPPRDPGVTGPVYLTGLEARKEVHRMRRWSDLVLVGVGTILADRPTLDGRLVSAAADCPAAEPTPGYVDTDLSADASWPGRPHLAFGGRASASAARVRAVADAGGRAVLCDERAGRVVPAALLSSLSDAGVRTVLLEGGPTLAHSFLTAGLVDRWVSFVAPVALGGGPTWPRSPDDAVLRGQDEGGRESRLSLTSSNRIGADARLVFDRVPFDETVRRLAAPVEA